MGGFGVGHTGSVRRDPMGSGSMGGFAGNRIHGAIGGTTGKVQNGFGSRFRGGYQTAATISAITGTRPMATRSLA
jgi:hypothetical protein